MDQRTRSIEHEWTAGGRVFVSYKLPHAIYLGRRVRYLKHGRHVDQGLADLAVRAPDEAERDGQLEEEAVHQHEIADRGVPGGWSKTT